MNPFAYHTPETQEEALALLHEHGDNAKLMAGGTALVIMMKQRLVVPETLISLHRLRGLTAVQETNGALHLGALLTHRAAETPPSCGRTCQCWRRRIAGSPRCASAMSPPWVGLWRMLIPIRTRPVTLLALDAQVQLASVGGSRTVPLTDFFTDYYETVLRPDELLTAIRVPIPQPHTGSAHVKFLPRTADDYATVGVAATVQVDPATGTCQDCRIALGSVGSTPLRARQAEGVVRGQRLTPELLREAGAVAQQQTDPISDTRGSADYKRAMAGVFVRRALEQAWQQALATPS